MSALLLGLLQGVLGSGGSAAGTPPTLPDPNGQTNDPYRSTPKPPQLKYPDGPPTADSPKLQRRDPASLQDAPPAQNAPAPGAPPPASSAPASPYAQAAGPTPAEDQYVQANTPPRPTYQAPGFWKRAANVATAAAGGALSPKDNGGQMGQIARQWQAKDAAAKQAPVDYDKNLPTLRETIRQQYLKDQEARGNIVHTTAETNEQNAAAENQTAEAQARKNPPPAHVPPGEMVQKKDGSWEQVGTPKPPAAETAETDKLKFETTVGKIAKEGLPTDPAHLPQSLTKSKTLSPEEKASAQAWQAANPNPSTNVQVSTAEAANKASSAKADKYYSYSDGSGTHLVKGDKVPDGVDSIPVKDPEALVREAKTGNIIQKSINQISQDVHESPEIFDNAVARNILATTLEQVDRTSAGMLVAGTGGEVPLPSGLGDMLNTALQNKALDEKTGKAVRQYVADYKAMKDKVMAMQMEMQGGKIGRTTANSFKAIADQVPNGATPDSKTAVRQVENFQRTQSELMEQYPDKYGDYTKEKPYAPGGDQELSNFHVNPKTGERIGWDGKAWVPAPKKAE